MSVVSSEPDRLESFSKLLRVPQLQSLSARELLMQATRFERVEADFIRRFAVTRKPVKISVLASLSVQHLCSSLKLFLYAEGLIPIVRVSGYDAIASGLLAANEPILSDTPDVLLLLPSSEDIKTWPRMFATDAEVADWVERKAELYLGVWEAVARNLPSCRVYHSLFVLPLERPLGNLENLYPFSRRRSLRALNDYLTSKRPRHVSIIDMDALAEIVGRKHWNDEAGYFLSKQSVALRELPSVAAYLARIIASGCGIVRKCLVVDLDNTLWGGTVGDDGVQGIRIDPSDPVGEAFLHFQRYLLALKERGVLLAVCSKNDESVARRPFVENPNMVLKLDDFAAFCANWDDKVTNIRRIAKALNIGIESVVFFDDNPAERAIVDEFEPSVLTINVPSDPALYVRALDGSFAFEWDQLTEEDFSRAETHAMDRERKALGLRSSDYDSYLKSLEMNAWIEPVKTEGLRRLAQLFGKTNQFNTRTMRYSESTIAQLANTRDSCVLQVRFADRFSNYGIVAGAVLKLHEDAVFIDNWIMSCRVFERGLEYATFEAIAKYAEKHHRARIVGEFIPTPKNIYVEGLFERLGFQPMMDAGLQAAIGGVQYVLQLSSRSSISTHINVLESSEADLDVGAADPRQGDVQKGQQR